DARPTSGRDRGGARAGRGPAMTGPAAAPAGSRAGAPVAAPVVDEGGDPACWAHLFDAEVDDAEVDDAEVDDAEVDDAEVDGPSGEVAVDLRRVTDGGPGAVWSLPHGGDLDANLVLLAPHGEVGEHVNRDVDVLLAVQDGTGEV